MSDKPKQNKGGNKGKKRHQSSYHGSYYAKKQKMAGRTLAKDMRGFFITCNMREKEATTESYALLNEYADKLYGKEFEEAAKSGFWDERASDEEEDIEKAIDKEVKQTKEQAKSKDRRFQAVDSGASNIVFVKTSLPNPNELLDAIITDVYEKKIPKSRYIMRMYPVAGTCKLQEYEDEIENILRPFFADGIGHSFYLKIKIRNNDGSKRDGIFKKFCYVIKGLNMENKPNYNTYEYIVIIDVIKTVMCVSVLKNFKLYSEYNLQQLGNPLIADFEAKMNPESKPASASVQQLTAKASEPEEEESQQQQKNENEEKEDGNNVNGKTKDETSGTDEKMDETNDVSEKKDETSGNDETKDQTIGDVCEKKDETLGDGEKKDETLGDGEKKDEASGDGEKNDETLGDGEKNDETLGDGEKNDETLGDGEKMDETSGNDVRKDEALGNGEKKEDVQDKNECKDDQGNVNDRQVEEAKPDVKNIEEKGEDLV